MPRTVPVAATQAAGNLITAAMWNASVVAAVNFLTGPPIAVITQTSVQTFTTGVAAAVQFNSSIVDTDGGHSNTVNNTRYTAQVAGWYWFRGNVLFTSNSAGNRSAQLSKNGSGLTTSFVVFPAASTNYAAMGIETASMVQMAVGDYVELSASQDTGGNLTTYTSTGSSNLQVFWLHS